MKTKSILTAVLTIMFGVAVMAATPAKKTNAKTKMTATATYKKKYTNADFYTNGKFNQEVAMKAYKDMFAFYGVEFTELMAKNMWVSDFGLGDFEHVGMGGIFWINDAEHNYFGHEIYLLPNQMIVEHAHVPTKYKAKFESWLVRNGSCFNFGIGETTANNPAIPASQKGFTTVSHCEKLEVGDIRTLAKIESKHFLMGGPGGVIVTEFGCYHDNDGLRFTNPGVKF